MTPEKVIEVMEMYCERVQRPEELMAPDAADKILDMLPRMREFAKDPTKTEKLMRWLGFAQGVLWAEGVYKLEELKDHNRS